MKRLSQTLTYPGATLEQVFAMLGDPDFRKAVGERQHVQGFSCEITPDGDGMTVRMEQVHGTDDIPSFAKRIVGNEIRFDQHEAWGSPTDADITITIPGKPGDVKGTATLRQEGDAVLERLDLEVKVSIPLVGGKVEDLVAGFIAKACASENKVGLRWLAGERGE